MLNRFLLSAKERWSNEGIKVDKQISYENYNRTTYKRSKSNYRTRTDSSESYDNVNYKNLCLLKGQTGCGKVTTVKLLCKRLGLKVIEYDPFECDSMKYTNYGMQDYMGSLISFLQTTYTRHGLKLKDDEILNDCVEERIPKRIALLKGHSINRNNTNSAMYFEPHVILLSSLPRSTNSNRYFNSLSKVQQILKTILDGNSDKDAREKSFPLLICANNSHEDGNVLRKIMPINYTKHPKFCGITLPQITKAKMKQFISANLKCFINENVLNYMAEASCGDIRFALENVRFYSIGMTYSSQLNAILPYMLRRCPQNYFFGTLGKVLYNKRVPVTLIADEDNKAQQIDTTSIADTFHQCMTMSRNFDVLVRQASQLDDILSDYTDVMEIISSIASDIDDMASSCIEYKEQNPHSDDIQKKYVEETPIKTLFPNDFEDSPFEDLPLLVRCFGLLDAFSQQDPLSFTRWPRIISNSCALPCRYPRESMFPKLFRPQMYYDPEDLIDTFGSENVNYAHAIFDNYTDFFSCIDDCARLCTNFCIGDIVNSGFRSTLYTTEDVEQMNRWLVTFCARAVVDANASAKNPTAANASDNNHGEGRFYAFNKSTMYSELNAKIEHVRDLYKLYRTSLVQPQEIVTFDQFPMYSQNLSSQRTAFVDVLPSMHRASMSETQGSDPGDQSSIPLDISLTWTTLLDKVDDYITSQENSMKTPQHPSVTCNLIDVTTPALYRLLSEVSRYYQPSS
ncbi:bifunctional Checkpoint protein Rad17-Rad24/P-loop containing nucleoside triphosphate hydrolase [Babesia duncani]|uniref:Bifunctional Checkpoint protein Rad17-Rad24/P-loop containing nucleoside triphosphate hydrolase n=1 Tax=Babesia duncani TaxID=323732 RepID=A0AAD9UP74_9APIC|nr:bifunctional Checkpoint protein Rad17-Rad24/P-loop containing nucleoside triphosphate hydrolase [Babesia duncani]